MKFSILVKKNNKLIKKILIWIQKKIKCKNKVFSYKINSKNSSFKIQRKKLIIIIKIIINKNQIKINQNYNNNFKINKNFVNKTRFLILMNIIIMFQMRIVMKITNLIRILIKNKNYNNYKAIRI